MPLENGAMKLYRLMLLLVLSVFLPLGIAQAPKTTGAETKKAQVKKATPSADLIDINSASTDQLKALPGIGDAYSKKIIDGAPLRKHHSWSLARSFRRPRTTRSRIKSSLSRRNRLSGPSFRNSCEERNVDDGRWEFQLELVQAFPLVEIAGEPAAECVHQAAAAPIRRPSRGRCTHWGETGGTREVMKEEI
jgi:competence protein ComEA